MTDNQYIFFIGGKDLEMETIKQLLSAHNQPYIDKNLGWGAKTSAYEAEISRAAADGKTPVVIELEQDCKLPENAINIDHHNQNAGHPASVLQICDLLGIEKTRDLQLIGANDAAYIPGMMEMDAAPEEIARVRRRDRMCQGITEEQEKEAERAISKKEEICGVTIVRMAHSKTATVADRLFEKDKQQNLLILSDDGEANYFGDGKLCKMLQGNVIGEQPAPWDANQTIPVYDNFGGWNGGAGLGDENGNAFWGGYPDHEKVLNYIVSYNREKQERTAAKTNATKLAKTTGTDNPTHGRNKTLYVPSVIFNLLHS